MKRLGLLVGLTACLLSSCALFGPSAPVVLPPDPGGATLTQVQKTGYVELTYLPGKSGTLSTVEHLVGPALRVNDTRCQVETAGLACTFGTVPRDEKRVVYVSGLSSATLDAVREDGSPVHISAR